MELILTVGPWQSIMAIAALRQMEVPPGQVAVVQLTNPSETALIELCRKIHETEGHRYLGYASHAQCMADDIPASVKQALANCRRIWAVSLGRSVSHLLELTPASIPVVIYEDGMAASTPQFIYGFYWESMRKSYARLLWQYVKRSVTKRRLWFRRPDYLRIELMITYLHHIYDHDALLEIPKIKLESRYLLEALNGPWFPDKTFPPSEKPRLIIAGTNFINHGGGGITPSQEYGLIGKAMKALAEDYEVWWKAHPRADPIFTEYLQTKYPFIRTLDTDLLHVPIEGLIPRLGIQKLVSPFSSSLLYAKSLYNIETQLLGGFEALIPLLGDSSLKQIYKVFRQNVPTLDLPQGSSVAVSS